MAEGGQESHHLTHLLVVEILVQVPPGPGTMRRTPEIPRRAGAALRSLPRNTALVETAGEAHGTSLLPRQLPMDL